MKNRDDIFKRIKKEAQQMHIPESIRPDQMRLRLEKAAALEKPEKKHVWRKYRKALVTAACFCVAFGGMTAALQYGRMKDAPAQEESQIEQNIVSDVSGQEKPVAAEKLNYPEVTYEEIYASMLSVWEEASDICFRDTGEFSVEEAEAEDAVMESASAVDLSMSKSSAQKEIEDKAYGTTNVQTAGVDEGDVVKNDGRYLYQIIDIEDEGEYRQAIQIVDTKDGLKKLSSLDDFENISEFYVWEDVLVVIENKYRSDSAAAVKSSMMITCEVECWDNYYHEISFYDMADRSKPSKIKTFTLQGRYASSRIADGYFYGFSRFYANPGEGENDYDAYIPVLDGARLEADKIFLPENNKGTSYLVLVAVNLKNPTEFSETTAIVSEAEQYYVSNDHIYVTDYEWVEVKDGWSSDKTSILKFSYGSGTFSYLAKGEVQGNLDDSFSLDEYEGKLRAVTTVQVYRGEMLVDDRTGEEIGYDIIDTRQTNALYVLDENMKLIGQIEGLAEDEQIYAARFMGCVGYFVTFRQTDPLFAVDLSVPAAPKLLNELKVSGFSDYLHLYGEGRLLGVGMEADEETGQQKGMKLSMFDISDPADVQEIAKLSLEKYTYSEALYNHKAVLISPGANLFGFEAEGSSRGEYWRKYLVFSYKDEQFVQELELDAKDADGDFCSVRGTFIGDTIYLLCRDGSVRSYDRKTGKQLESLER